MSFFKELKRRNVFRVAIAYVILAWLMAQVAEMLLETFGAPDWALKTLLAAFLVGFPFALFFAWAFELTPDGLKKEKDVDRSQSVTPQTGRKLDFSIIAVLVLALGYFVWDKFVGEPTPQVIPIQVASEDGSESSSESTLPTDKSIAVLPFDNRSRNEDDEFFTTGIHDDLLTQLAQISSLRVISRTSVAQFKDTTKSIREIAELLEVSTILEGGVQRAGNQVRINMQLIDAATDAHLWAQTFDRELTADNIFAIQSEISSAVASAMRTTLTPEEQERVADVPTRNMEALEEYFKGRAELDQRTLPAIESARLRFEHARQLDPEFAMAWAGEALAILLLSDGGSSYGDIPMAEAIALARSLLVTAYALSPSDPQVLAVYGLLERNDENIEKALEYYDQSLLLNPSSGEVLNWNRMALNAAGKLKESSDVAVRMIEVDPMSMITLYNGIASLINTPNDDPQRIELLLQRLEDMNLPYGLSARGIVRESRGDIVSAVSTYFRVLELDPGRSSTRDGLASLLARMGLGVEAAVVAPGFAENIPFIDADWEENLRIRQEEYDRNPDSIGLTMDMVEALMAMGDPEAAFPYVQQVWNRYGEKPAQLGGWMLSMAWVAQQSEHPAEFRLYRDAASRFIQSLIESGNTHNYRYRMEFQLAVIDDRISDAALAASKAIEKGARWYQWSEYPLVKSVAHLPEIQAQINRHNDLIYTEKLEILTFICGPDTILSSWKPALETCDQYQPEVVNTDT